MQTSLTDRLSEHQSPAPPAGAGHPDFRRLFRTLGLDFGDPNGTREVVRDRCPWCPAGRFHLDVSTGWWRCPHCDESGNVYDFLRRVHRECSEATAADDYRRLAAKRGLRNHSFKRHGLAWNASIGCWLVPFKSECGHVVNLTRYFPETGDKPTLPILPLRLYGLDRIAPEADRAALPLFLVEGPFDLIALDQQLTDRKTRTRFDMLAVPSAGVFKPEWLRYLKGRTVRLCLDNDKAGRAGQDRIARLVRDNGIDCNLIALQWPPGHPPKADIGDLVRDKVNVAEFTREHCVPVANLGQEVAHE